MSPRHQRGYISHLKCPIHSFLSYLIYPWTPTSTPGFTESQSSSPPHTRYMKDNQSMRFFTTIEHPHQRQQTVTFTSQQTSASLNITLSRKYIYSITRRGIIPKSCKQPIFQFPHPHTPFTSTSPHPFI